MRWRTYTPDGRMLDVDHEDGTWHAVCNGVPGTGASALEAIRTALDEGTAPLGSTAAALETWAREQAAALEREVSGSD